MVSRAHKALDSDAPVLVIGLGRFGSAVALELTAQGQDVMAIERDRTLVQRYSGLLTHVIEADATDPDALRQVGADEFSVAVVGVGTSIESSVLITVNLVDLDIEHVWAKAITPSHGTILKRIGAKHVIFPEQDAGERTAHLLSGKMLDFMEFSQGFAIAQIYTPDGFAEKSLQQLQLRTRFGITVVGVRSGDSEVLNATPDTVLQEHDTLIIAGPSERLERFADRH